MLPFFGDPYIHSTKQVPWLTDAGVNDLFEGRAVQEWSQDENHRLSGVARLLRALPSSFQEVGARGPSTPPLPRTGPPS